MLVALHLIRDITLPLLKSAIRSVVLALMLFSLACIRGPDEQAVVTSPPLARGAAGLVLHANGSYANCRFGVGAEEPPATYPASPTLNAGWYSDWGAQVAPPRPGGIEYVQVLRVSDNGYTPSGAGLAATIAANPGALWLVGNEPDCIWQDNTLPGNYARVYHDAYAAIKAQDPTAQVAAGGIVQPTPLRLQYLDLVLEAYASAYGETLPADAWHTHGFILREASCQAYPDACWGCEIPPGISAQAGMLYTLDQTDDIDIFEARIVAFRRWMRARGYRDTPLLISEYGTLLPYYEPSSLYHDSQGRPFDEARARDYMLATFDYLRIAHDGHTGYPPDEDRLVQRWLWYSLDDSIAYGGALFDKVSTELLPLGTAFGAHTGSIAPEGDLVAVGVGQAGIPPHSPVEPVTVTLQARVSNIGNVAVTQPVTVRFYDEYSAQIGADQVLDAPLDGCAAARTVAVEWPNVGPGSHTVRVVVDPGDTVVEADEGNNEAAGVVLVAKHQLLMSVVLRSDE